MLLELAKIIYIRPVNEISTKSLWNYSNLTFELLKKV
jgi:hypothetical protein